MEIPEFPNYLIYNNGDIFSKHRKKLLSQRTDKCGYFRVNIINNFNVRKTYKIHQLVAMAYLHHKLENTKYCIDHIDGNRKNNYLHNLQVILKQQNLRKRKLIRDLPIGVYHINNKFYSCITINNTRYYLGIFKTIDDAQKVHSKIYNELMIGVKFTAF